MTELFIPDFSHKKIYIAPHSPQTTMFKKKLCDHFPTSTFLGYIDKVKEGEDIHKLKDIADTSFDFILILSQNHFDKIYDDHKHHISLNKLYKIDIKDNRYHFLARNEILRYKFQVIPQQISMLLLKFLTRLNYILNLSGRKVVFVAKGFVGANTKMLFLYHATVDNQTILLTDNVQQLKSLKNVGLKVFPLFSLRAIWTLAFAKIVIQDQGNYIEPLL